jgi:hypothetical protein
VRDLERGPARRIDAPRKPLDCPFEDAEARRRGRFRARAKEHLKTEADPEIGPLGLDVRASRLPEGARQSARAIAEASLARHDQLVGASDPRHIARHFDLAGPASSDLPQRVLYAAEVAQADVANDDAHRARHTTGDLR